MANLMSEGVISSSKITVAPERIFLRDQLDEQDKLIEILRGHISSLEEILSPILLQEPSEGSDEKEPGVGPKLAPLQHQLMSQYNDINMAISRIENIRRRVQL